MEKVSWIQRLLCVSVGVGRRVSLDKNTDLISSQEAALLVQAGKVRGLWFSGLFCSPPPPRTRSYA